MVDIRVKLFVEGGGEGGQLRTECRRGFRLFLERAGLAGCMPQIVACGTRRQAYDDFCRATRHRKGDEFPMLLVDSECAPLSSNAWEHVHRREGDKWPKPDAAADAHLHLMIQCMESWFLADPDALISFYGQGFQRGALPQTNPAEVDKARLFDALKQATRDTKIKGRYHKARHAFQILGFVRPERVISRCPDAKRLVETLKVLHRKH